MNELLRQIDAAAKAWLQVQLGPPIGDHLLSLSMSDGQ
jgi:hypothetical protein